MGVPKTKWSAAEEAALISGVKKYGTGKWRLIQKDDYLGVALAQRSNVDLKDKWRNMHPTPELAEAAAEGARAAGAYPVGGGGGAGAGGKPRAAQRPKPPRSAALGHAAPPPDPAAALPPPDANSSEQKLEDLVFEAVRALRANATLEHVALAIEDKYDVPPAFRKQLAAHLKSLAHAGKLVKSRNTYSLPPKDGEAGAAGSAPRGKAKAGGVAAVAAGAEAAQAAAEAAMAAAEAAAGAANAAAAEAAAAEAAATELEAEAGGVHNSGSNGNGLLHAVLHNNSSGGGLL